MDVVKLEPRKNGNHIESTEPIVIPKSESILKQRGIYNAAISAGWKFFKFYKNDGWGYPVYRADGTRWHTQRWKAMPGEGEQKYLWGFPKTPTKPVGCDIYWQPYSKQAISDAEGVLMITAGEPDMLTLIELGHKNVCSFFGESNIPHNLIEILEYMGVYRVEYYSDPDEAGQKAAVKLFQKVAPSSIDISCYRFADPVKDINDYWQQFEFKTQPMLDFMADERIELKIERPVPVIQEVGIQSDFVPPVELLNEIWGVLNLERGKKDYSKHIHCPSHDDKTPSAQWNYRTHQLECLSGCEPMGWKQVAERNQIDWRKYLDTSKPQLEKPDDRLPDGISDDASSIRIVDANDALDIVIEELDGKHLSANAPIPFPFTVLHKLGGMAHVLEPRMMCGVLGLSGGGKTSWLECMIELFRKQGVDCGYWGSEWSPEAYMRRQIQRMGGLTLTQMALHRTWLAEQDAKAKGRRTTKAGIRASDEMIMQARQKRDEIKTWDGRLYIVDKAGITLRAMLDRVAQELEIQKQNGHNIRVFFWDYAQLLSLDKAHGDRERINIAVSMIKAFCIDHELIGFIASQPNKGDSRDAKNGVDVLGSESANFMTDNEFNLFMTLNPVFNGNTLPQTGIVNVTKNSAGRKDRVRMKIDFRQLRWLDIEA